MGSYILVSNGCHYRVEYIKLGKYTFSLTTKVRQRYRKKYIFFGEVITWWEIIK